MNNTGTYINLQHVFNDDDDSLHFTDMYREYPKHPKQWLTKHTALCKMVRQKAGNDEVKNYVCSSSLMVKNDHRRHEEA